MKVDAVKCKRAKARELEVLILKTIHRGMVNGGPSFLGSAPTSPCYFHITSHQLTTPPQTKSARELQDDDNNPKWSRRTLGKIHCNQV